MKSPDIAQKKNFFCTLVPIIILNLTKNGKKKKVNVRQRKVNTVHLLKTSSTIRFSFPSSDHRSHFNLELAVVKKLLKAQRVWLRGHRGH